MGQWEQSNQPLTVPHSNKSLDMLLEDVLSLAPVTEPLRFTIYFSFFLLKTNVRRFRSTFA